MEKLRIFLSGVGGQGTLTATNLIGLMAMDKGIDVVCGEIHGMAQRGGSVESYVLLGGYKSPKIDEGEADILLGFEPLEGLKSLHYLKKDGVALFSVDPIYPPGVSLGKEFYPDLENIKQKIKICTNNAYFVSSRELAKKTKVIQTSNTIMLAIFCTLDISPFSIEDLENGIKKYMPLKIQEANLKAIDIVKEEFL